MKIWLVRFKSTPMSWWSFDHYGLVIAGDLSWKNQQAEADRIAQRVLTEVVTDLETSYQVT